MTDTALSDKVCIVTGGGRGLGRAMTLSLVGGGARVVAPTFIEADIPNIEAEAKNVAGNTGGAVHGMPCDVRNPDDCARVVGATIERFGKIDMLINNAGVGMLLISDTFTSTPTKFWEAPVDPVRAIIETNFLGPFLMARCAVPHMLAQGWGRIVNVTTSVHTMQRRGFFPYGPAKAAFEAATSVWSEDLDGTGVTVNILIPGGAADTNLLPGEVGDKSRSGADGKLVDPQVMAAPIRWLASKASNGINGMRFIGDQWDLSMDPSDAARAVMMPVGFAPRT